MKTSRKIELLNRLLEKSKDITNESANDSEFKSWKNLVERTFIKLFDTESIEVKQLNNLKFSYNGMQVSGIDYRPSHLEYYRRSFSTVIKSIMNYIEEFKDDVEEEIEINQNPDSLISKVFISHSSLDKNIVEELIDILETIGLNSTQIFCSSFEGYGINFGEDFLDRIKEELNSEVLVLFLLSNNFYSSPISLCEMGATWMKTNQHIPILIPPMDFKDIKGVIPLTQGFKINNPQSLSHFKSQIEEIFNLQKSSNNSTWERKRDRILNRIDKHLNGL
ncbi:toll/interleukin-1 receptor domain-containing protein [Flavobacterium gelidilacus]|uniref:toll/interleukin-1 receptor domain-containing protein n=1 Tax=Flavobacterium gelidilacus TaxID=206041 RepID=UPI000406D211|nr:toll/interleukin-1 receptor domain-containing protein [Flavobacterium gelidilacus]